MLFFIGSIWLDKVMTLNFSTLLSMVMLFYISKIPDTFQAFLYNYLGAIFIGSIWLNKVMILNFSSHLSSVVLFYIIFPFLNLHIFYEWNLNKLEQEN